MKNLTDILEFHQLYDLQVDIKLLNHIDNIKTATQEIIEEIINSNKSKNQTKPTIPRRMEEIFTNVRNGIPSIVTDKEKAKLFETLLEKISKHYYFINTGKKKKPGRPKKNNQKIKQEHTNSTLDTFLHHNIKTN